MPASQRKAVPPGKNLLIRRLRMRVCADYGAHAPIEKTAHGDFLARGFRVAIDKNHGRFLAQPRHFLVHREKRDYRAAAA
jgi:hypothetical protein